MAAPAPPPAALPPAAAAPQGVGPEALTVAQEWLETLGKEVANARCKVYLLTFSRLLEETLATTSETLRHLDELTRAELCECVRDAFENPAQHTFGGGRPRGEDSRLVCKLVVVKEKHADGTAHFHVAVLLYRHYRWTAVKRALRNKHKLVAHFSCSHTEWWSALRYIVCTTEKKPEVDQERVVWTAEGETCDPEEESRQPYQAAAWRKNREKRDNQDLAKGKSCTFTKLDFISLVISKELHKKSSVLRYVQDHGTDAMRVFVTNNQRKIKDLLEDAAEWRDAREVAAEEELTDWALLARAAETPCSDGGDCPYHKAASEILHKNRHSFNAQQLAVALRNIIVSGPSKNTRVPFLAGCTNSGKSTLVESFDDVYGAPRVFHLPAATDAKYALSNWRKAKRFVYWDEFDPVEFADKGVLPATTFKKAFGGQYFEIQVPQCFSDGNLDFRWQRGVVFTNKMKGLWRTTNNVTAEDLAHIQSRVEVFHFTHQLFPPGTPPPNGPVPQCRHHMAKWIVELSSLFDSAQGLQQMPPAAAAADESGGGVTDLAQFLSAAKLPPPAIDALTKDITESGAVHVQELTREDWQQLPSWSLLKPLQRRRLLQLVPA